VLHVREILTRSELTMTDSDRTVTISSSPPDLQTTTNSTDNYCISAYMINRLLKTATYVKIMKFHQYIIISTTVEAHDGVQTD